MSTHVILVGGFVGCMAALAVGQTDTAPAASAPLLFPQVRYFDGTDFQTGDVLVKNGKIEQLATKIPAVDDWQVIPCKGRTLLPGLIDSHVHAFFEGHMRQAILFGVTTELDMMSVPRMMSMMRRVQNRGGAQQRADIYSAGAAVTVENGHGTQFGFPVPTLRSAKDADAFVKARVDEGSDYIKIIYDDGWAFGIDFPTLTSEMLEASIRSAHKYDKLAVAHIGSRNGARDAIQFGIDGLVHLFADQPIAEPLLNEFVEKDVFVIPTTAVLAGVVGRSTVDTLLDEPAVSQLLTSENKANLRRSFPVRANSKSRWEHLKHNIQHLHDAGVDILAGTDAPNPNTVHGASMHHELELLVECGLSPAAALAAATSLPAKRFALHDRGAIQEGLRADLFLVDGDPSENIRATRQIANVWKAGRLIDRQWRFDAVQREQKSSITEAAADRPRPISDFEDGQLSSDFGSGWSPSTDKIMGGNSTTELTVVQQGANNTQHALQIRGSVREEQPAFAGAMFTPADGGMKPMNLSAHEMISFWVQGEDRDYQVMLFSQKRGFQPSTKTFRATKQWKEYRYKFSDFDGCDATDVMGLWFGTTQSGDFKLRVDQIGLQN